MKIRLLVLNETSKMFIPTDIDKNDIEKVSGSLLETISGYKDVTSVHLTNGKVIQVFGQLSEINKKINQTLLKG